MKIITTIAIVGYVLVNIILWYGFYETGYIHATFKYQGLAVELQSIEDMQAHFCTTIHPELSYEECLNQN